ncbi:MAG: DUF1801 domain-containing protein, partial [Microthrixaceae bacterium]|nr:DUF1801 domain-containing protein [Microthrixaceae bacterium]
MASSPNPKVDFFFTKSAPWESETAELRRIMLDCDLTEELKWGKPCYTADKANVVLIQTFKNYCALLFPKGALLDDPAEILVRMTDNVQAARQIRFANVDEIKALEPSVRAYVAQAEANEAAGLQVEMKDTADFEMVDEFKERLEEMPALREAFERLTPGRQRGYLLHFSSAKQSKTR